ncbi:polymorphic toxin-type HINT domain-containing protein [Rodentibacter caecimuris]|uniref:polymorphic toxin-type HINT domain-containing protein n=1 Tax=Rodentibacter caecimuris TaxID=1796644 RepID=UPI001F3E493F
MLSENNQWQTVKGVSIKREKLSAYNLMVETDHTYFIKGAGEDTDGVWVHNDCWQALPKGAKQVKDIDGYPAYQFKDSSGQTVTVLKKDLNRFETPNHRVGVEPHFNRLSHKLMLKPGAISQRGMRLTGFIIALIYVRRQCRKSLQIMKNYRMGIIEIKFLVR